MGGLAYNKDDAARSMVSSSQVASPRLASPADGGARFKSAAALAFSCNRRLDHKLSRSTSRAKLSAIICPTGPQVAS